MKYRNEPILNHINTLTKKNKSENYWLYYSLKENACAIISGKIKSARKERKLTQKQASAKTNTELEQFCKIERGVHNPTINTLEKIAAGLNKKIVFDLQ